MIIFIAEGRLGNQIFQYVFLKTLKRRLNKKLYVFGFDELNLVFDKLDFVTLVRKNLFTKIAFYKIVRPILNILSRLHIISSYKVIREHIPNYKCSRETCRLKITTGYLKNIIYVHTAFFQSECFFDTNIINSLQIKGEIIEQARKFLNEFGKKELVAVHVRRGDYKQFKICGKSALLPISYYHQTISMLQKELGNNVFFVFLSDEPDFVESNFGYLDNKIISKNNASIDFAIMTMCKHAIVSPSSFAWWGTYLMRKKGIILAPKHWLGFRVGVDYHENSLHKYMIPVKINKQ